MRLAAAFLALSCTPALAADPTGAWSGTYSCGQGLTSGDLVIARSNAGSLQAVFHFFAHPSNPGVPEGCFSMFGAIDANGHISLRPMRWIVQPPNYLMAGLEGEIDPLGTSIDGRVVAGAANCNDVHLRYTVSLPPARAACRVPP